ncbi:hypothetical protein WA026_010291 [Henosepilachna vigintioctopunctata]|uniref:SEA domain-containing protein n=1 Tax=Henosepilachna vigintioctopunctata TaxID=420089 RepID=A0AAW1UJX8_9CUCU
MTESPTIASQIFPPAPKSFVPVIKKFSAQARPPSTNSYPKRKSLAQRKFATSTTTVRPITLEESENKGQQYILDPQFHFPAPQDDFYNNQNKPLQFQNQFTGYSPLDSYLPQRDLQTSDLPFHLQKTLPQYRFTTKEQLPKSELPYHNNIIFRPDHERAIHVAPSTHRPNYSHYLSLNHNRHPSQSETFLGEITLNDPFGKFNNYETLNDNKKKFLREHTRILAPDPEEKQNQLQENKYFVNENGEVFSTTALPADTIFLPKKLSAKLEIQEETPASQEFRRNNIIDTDNSQQPGKTQDQIFNSANNFDSTDYEYEDEEVDPIPQMNDSDYSTEKSNTKENLTKTSIQKTDDEDIKKIIRNDIPGRKQIDDYHEDTKFDEPVVSVITTKSVINNTVIATTPSPLDTIHTTSISVGNSTDSWVVVASVQTSKSISGARYLPSSIVAQEERFTLLNEKDRQESSEEITTTERNLEDDEYEDEATTEDFITQTVMKHSTESLIDKLDRVQSDLSSVLLTGGYKNEDNNIAVITENITDKTFVAEMTESPTIASQIFPPAPKSFVPVIKKFSAQARPPSTNLYPKRKSLAQRKFATSTTTVRPITLEESENKGLPKFTIAKSDALLPPGYKAPTEKDSSSELLNELLKKFKDATTKQNEKAESNNKLPSNDTPQHRFGVGNDTHAENTTTSSYSSEELLTSTNVSSKTGKLIGIKDIIPNGFRNPLSSIDSILKKTKLDDISAFLPPGYSSKSASQLNSSSTDGTLDNREAHDKTSKYTSSSDVKPTVISVDTILQKSKQEKNIGALLPSGYQPPDPTSTKKSLKIDDLLQKSKEDDLSGLLPPGYKLPDSTTKKSSKIDDLLQNSKQDDISSLLPPGFKLPNSTSKKSSKIEDLLQNSKEDDISAFLPPGFKPKSHSTSSKPKTNVKDIFEQSKKDDISAFLPPGYKSKSYSNRKSTSVKPSIEKEYLPTSLLPSGYKSRKDNEKDISSTQATLTTISISTASPTPTTSGKQGLKVVFPSRPGGKKITHRTTTSKPKQEKEPTQAAVPMIHKGWPTRATTEFTGWPTPSTTPISIEKLLAYVQRTSTIPEIENITTTTSTTQTTVTSTTTTARPTTPGLCVEECDLVGTIKLIDGVKWVPELLDRNTKEWQLLANEVQTQLKEVFTKSYKLGPLFKNLRIDGFSEGSVLVDYLVEMNNVDKQVSTSQIKKLFNEALDTPLDSKYSSREGKSLNDSETHEEKAKLGKFIIDRKYTDFIVVPKHIAPTVGYAEDNLLLPQWAIAVIVIGLASLLFVIIFGVTVLVNRSKNAKKKVPVPLTDEMLNELNKNHMSFDNYGLDDQHSIEAGFWDPRRMDAQRDYKIPKKVSGSSGSIPDNSMTNLYDSWKSQWNGYYNNSTGGYYGNPGPGSSHRLYERRRSYDTNF